MTIQTWHNVPSKSLGMRTTLSVITPEGGTIEPQARPAGEDPGLLILAHGLSGNHMMWPMRTDLLQVADKRNVVIVLPDGARSFWLDQEYGQNWGTWLGSEIPDIMRSTLRISTRREDTYIGGFSMGGYGAIRAAFDYPDTFGGVFSMSGTLDVAEDAFRGRHPDLYRQGFGNPTKPRPQDDLIARLEECAFGASSLPCPRRDTPMFVACGEGDRLLGQNQRFVEAAAQAHLDVEWLEAPGVHNFRFWNEWLPVALDTIIG